MDMLDRLESEAAGGAPVCVAIVNRTGKLAAFLSLDGTPERAEAIARSKAYTAMRMESTTQAFHDRLIRENLSIADFCDPDFPRCPEACPYSTKPGAASAASASAAENRRKTPNSPNVWPKSSVGKGIERQSEGTAGKRASHPYFSIHIDDNLSVAGRESISGPFLVSPQLADHLSIRSGAVGD